jgi:SRSO17 transposase
MSHFEFVEIADTPPLLNLSPPEVEALTEELVAYHGEFSDLFYRKEQAHWGYKYLQGLMLPLEHKPIQPMVMALEGGDIQAMQQLIGQGQWEDEKLLKRHWQLVDQSLGEADGAIIFDGSDFVKKGQHSVGVACQWCGHVGKVENCQAGVFAAYAGRKGYTLLDRRLYLHQEWFQPEHQHLWKKCGIPQNTPFRTKPELALQMLEAIGAESSSHFQWVTGDEGYGADPTFLEGVARLGKWYMAEVPHSTQVWTRLPQTAVPAWSGKGRKPTKGRLKPGQPLPERVDEIAQALPGKKWGVYQIKEGSKGPLGPPLPLCRCLPYGTVCPDPPSG